MRLRPARLLFTTNPLGASDRFAVGNLIEHDGAWWRIVKHRWLTPPGAPWPGVNVYATKARKPAGRPSQMPRNT